MWHIYIYICVCVCVCVWVGVCSEFSSPQRYYSKCSVVSVSLVRADSVYMFYIGEGIASGKHVVQTADQSARMGKMSTERRSNKMVDFSIRTTPLFFRLTLFQTHCDSYRENRFTLAVGAWIRHYTGHYFIYLGQ